MSAGTLTGRVALVTGSGRGMGRAHLHALAAAGAAVVVQDIDRELAEGTAAELSARGVQVHTICCDVSDVDRLCTAMGEVEARAGGIDILVNNAGFVSREGALEDIDEALYDRLMDVHVKGSFFATRAVVPGMKRRGFGRIVNVSSTWGIAGSASHSHYCAAKAALIGLTRAWARELAGDGITVNAIAPGRVWSDLQSVPRADYERRAREEVPLGRCAEVDEVARVLMFLLGDGGDFMTGQVLSPNGGEVIG